MKLQTIKYYSMDLKSLSPAELADLEKQVADQKAAIEQKKKDDIDAYRSLVSESVNKAYYQLAVESQRLVERKREVYGIFENALALKRQLFKVKESGQYSNSFINEEGNRRITLGTNTNDNYEDTANDGIEIVKEYLNSLGSSPDAKQLVDMCMSLLSRDKKGTLKASRIMVLRKHAVKSRNERFIEGVDIIMNAYKPVESKKYIRCEYKNDRGEWISVPLGMTDAE